MVPPIYHSLRRESVKNATSNQAMGVKSVRPIWFEDPTSSNWSAAVSMQGPHGLRLMIREDASPLKEQPNFLALQELAQRGMLAQKHRTVNEHKSTLRHRSMYQCLAQSLNKTGTAHWKRHMPIGWPLHIDGAVRQRCIHQGTPGIQAVPAQTSSLALRAKEDWERSICENKAVAILNQMQAGKKALIEKDGGEMLIAVVLDRPLAEAQTLVENTDAFMTAITKILEAKQNHPVIAQMLNPDVSRPMTHNLHDRTVNIYCIRGTNMGYPWLVALPDLHNRS